MHSPFLLSFPAPRGPCDRGGNQNELFSLGQSRAPPSRENMATFSSRKMFVTAQPAKVVPTAQLSKKV
jgi:hypothetical protein